MPRSYNRNGKTFKLHVYFTIINWTDRAEQTKLTVIREVKIFDHLNLIFYCFVGILQVLSFEFLKFRILEILNFHPCTRYL